LLTSRLLPETAASGTSSSTTTNTIAPYMDVKECVRERMSEWMRESV
jgi:hypothetical protein